MNVFSVELFLWYLKYDTWQIIGQSDHLHLL